MKIIDQIEEDVFYSSETMVELDRHHYEWLIKRAKLNETVNEPVCKNQRFIAIQIHNMKSIDGMSLKMVYAEKHGEAILYGEDSTGHQYPLDVLPLPKATPELEV